MLTEQQQRTTRTALYFSLAVLFAIAVTAIMPHASAVTSNNGTFCMTYSTSYAPGQNNWNHYISGGDYWAFNGTWAISTPMETAASQFASWSFASQYFEKGSYTTSKSGTIKFYNTTARDAAHYLGEGTLTYTYLGSGGYGSVELVMTHPLPSGTNFYPTANTMYSTVSDSTLAGIGSEHFGSSGSGAYGLTAGAFVAPGLSGTEGPVTGASFGYNYYTLSGQWQVDYTSVSNIINNYQLTPVGSSYRYWVEGSDGSIITPLTAFTGAVSTGTTIQRARVFVQDPFFNTTDNFFWMGETPTFNLTVSPKNITTSQSTSAIIHSSTGSFADIGALTIGCAPQACYYNGLDPTFLYTGGTWKQWNDVTNAYDITYGAAFPGSLPLTFAGAGHITLYADLIPKALGEDAIRLTDTVDVNGPQGAATLQISTKNCINNGLVKGATIDLLDVNTGTWNNRTSSTGRETFPINVNMPYGWTATASGYPNTEVLYNKFSTNASVDVLLCQNVTLGSSGNVSTRVWVIGSDTLKGISGILVAFGDQSKVTPDSGMVEFESLPLTDYQIQTADAGTKGYENTAQVYHTGSAGSTTSGITLQLEKIYQSEATPSVTDPNTGQPITPQQTIDTRTDEQKETDMAGDLVDYGPSLMGFFILLTFVGGLQMLMKK